MRGICGREKSKGGEEKLHDLSSLWEGHFLVELGEDLQVERGCGLQVIYLHHLVEILWGNEEKDVAQGRDDGFLFGNVVSLALERKLWEMMNLGEHIEGQIGLPEANLVALVQKDFPEP